MIVTRIAIGRSGVENAELFLAYGCLLKVSRTFKHVSDKA